MVGDLDAADVPDAAQAQLDAAVRRRILDCIRQQIGEQDAQQGRVAGQHWQAGRLFEMDAVAFRLQFGAFDGPGGDFADIDVGMLQREIAAVQPILGQAVVEEAGKACNAAPDAGKDGMRLRGAAQGQQLHAAVDDGERRTDLVRQHRDEMALLRLVRPDLDQCRLQGAVQAAQSAQPVQAGGDDGEQQCSQPFDQRVVDIGDHLDLEVAVDDAVALLGGERGDPLVEDVA